MLSLNEDQLRVLQSEFLLFYSNHASLGDTGLYIVHMFIWKSLKPQSKLSTIITKNVFPNKVTRSGATAILSYSYSPTQLQPNPTQL